MTTKTAKVFTNGGSQAVRLPAEFRFEVDEVYVRRDEPTGDIVLSVRPRSTWAEFMAFRNAQSAAPSEFMADRNQPTDSDRDPFGPWVE